MDNQFLNIFKKNIKIIHKKSQGLTADIFFQINFNNKGAYLKIVDNNNCEIEPDYELYSRPARQVIQLIQSIKNKKNFFINWNIPDNNLYLADNDLIIWHLKKCSNLIDSNQNPIVFSDETAEVFITLIENNENIKSIVTLKVFDQTHSSFNFINENYVLINNTIYSIIPFSNKYQALSLCNTNLKKDDLELFLSLVSSHFENIKYIFNDYDIEKASFIKTQPAILIEKIDETNSLYLKIINTHPAFDINFLDVYDISRLAKINSSSKKITFHELIHENIKSIFDEITGLIKKYSKSLNSEFAVEDDLIIIEEELAKKFLYNELSDLLTRFTIYGSEKLKTYKVKAVTPKLRFNMSHGIDFLEGDVQLEIENQTFSLFDVLNSFNQNSYIQLNDGTNAVLNKKYIDKLKRIFKAKKDNVKLSFFDLPLIEDIIDEKIADKTLKKSKEIFLGFNDIHNSKIKFPKLNAKLRSYQKQGYKWIKYLNKHNLGGCLADDMGLGKTLQAIALLSSIYPGEKKPTLIVVPKSLLDNWANEITKFNKKLSFYQYYGVNRDIIEAFKNNIIITTYGMMRNDIVTLKEKQFYYVILDESQYIKNPLSQTSRAAMLLNSTNKLALSGTPVENNLTELYSLFRFLNPSMFGAYEHFNKNYSYPIQKDNDEELLNELKIKIYPFILRRLKSEVLSDLPDKIEQTLKVDMDDDHKRFYEQKRIFFHNMINSEIETKGIKKSQFIILKALTELRQIATIPESKTNGRIISPKRDILKLNILDLVESNHKVLVFVNFLHAIECISKDLEKLNVKYVKMDGSTTNRNEVVEQFQNDENVKVFLMTLKTGGVGLNLTAADYIYIFDPWWNLAAENQAVDRTHRIGQKKTVFSYKLITKNSIEEKIIELQKKKKKLFEALLSSDTESIKYLDENDVDYILG